MLVGNAVGALIVVKFAVKLRIVIYCPGIGVGNVIVGVPPFTRRKNLVLISAGIV